MNLKKLERYLPVNLLGPGSRLIKKNLPGRDLTKVEKHYFRECGLLLMLRSRNVNSFETFHNSKFTVIQKVTQVTQRFLFFKHLCRFAFFFILYSKDTLRIMSARTNDWNNLEQLPG